DNGCLSDTLFRPIEVITDPAAPVIRCGIASLTSVEFVWDSVPGAIGYTVSIDGGPATTQTDTSFLVDGLNQGDLVSIEVTSIGNVFCGNGSAGTQTCEAGSCPTIIVTGMADQDFCTGAINNVVTLTATQVGGTGAGVFTFTGPGVSDNAGVFTFDADAAGPGNHQINVLYDENTCTGVDSFLMNVTETPASNFALNGVENPINVCSGDDFLAAYTGPLTAADGATYTWDFAGATVTPLAAFENYTLSFPTAGTFTVSLQVILNGCPSAITLYQVTVDAPLTPPVITCTASDLNSVTFSWDPVPGAEGYELGDGTMLPGSQTSFTLTGLLPGQDTTLMVTAISTDVCGNSTAAISELCSAADCPTLSLDVTGLMDQTCLLVGNETIDLSTVLVTGGTGNGTYTFSGTGVTGSVFDAAAAGGSEAGTVHTITLDYVEEGPCSFSGTFEVTVFERPSVFITEPVATCINDGVQLIVGSTNFVANDDITIDFDGGTVLDDGNPDDNVYLVSWPTPGTKMVTATVVSNISGCVSLPFTRSVTIEAPLEVPVVSCPATAELEAITFSWGAVTGATGYEVTVNPGGTTTVDAATTTFEVTGLSPETAVSISVIALGNGPCGNSTPGLGACETAPCPGGSVQAVTSSADFGLDGNQQAFLLEAALDQGTPSGPFVWSGTGVVDNGDGTYNFDPAGLGSGAYTLTVDYLGEADCTSSDEITINLFDQPNSTITAASNVICAGTNTLVGLTGAVDPDATYTWDFAGAAQADGPLAESYNLSWPVAGDYTVSLTVAANGCSTTSTVMVTVDPPANSGNAVGDNLELCAGATETVDLNTLLTGQAPGGTWMVAPTSPSNVGGVNISSGVFNAGQLSAGDYIFAYEVTSGSCPAASTDVELRLLPPPVADAGLAQRLTCTMGMATLDGTGSETGVGYTYRWFSNDPAIVIMGGDDPTLDVSQPGMYFLEVTNAIGCSSIAEVEVTAETEAPVMEVDVSNISCFSADDGAILVTSVSGGRAPYTFMINGEERGQSTLFAGLMAQEYNLQVTDANGCFSNLILDLTEPEELTVRLNFPGDSTIVGAGEQVTITATVNGGNPVDTLIWMPDSINTGESRNAITFTASETQMITITVVDELGCRATDREMLLVRKDRPVYFPNAFSPNGDNINDIWFIGGDLDEIEFIDNFFIFNRWGEAVYSGGQVDVGTGIAGGDGTQFLPNDPAFGWDGNLNGRPMNPQVLVYTATVHFRDGEVIVYKGDFVLMK
ncbi:MAG: gliding motility-associated C-terminal domain-containing protein, partial [Bacteroidota bacterium]